ncbi:MAG: hypothetical protein OHK0046_45230 [Anaerolineae bacterium]
MADKKTNTKDVTTQSGILPRPSLEPKILYETPPPTSLPEMRDEGATTGAMPIVLEGEDRSAQRDDDEG